MSTWPVHSPSALNTHFLNAHSNSPLKTLQSLSHAKASAAQSKIMCLSFFLWIFDDRTFSLCCCWGQWEKQHYQSCLTALTSHATHSLNSDKYWRINQCGLPSSSKDVTSANIPSGASCLQHQHPTGGCCENSEFRGWITHSLCSKFQGAESPRETLFSK